MSDGIFDPSHGWSCPLRGLPCKGTEVARLHAGHVGPGPRGSDFDPGSAHSMSFWLAVARHVWQLLRGWELMRQKGKENVSLHHRTGLLVVLHSGLASGTGPLVFSAGSCGRATGRGSAGCIFLAPPCHGWARLESLLLPGHPSE